MKIRRILIMLLVLPLLSGCAPYVTGREDDNGVVVGEGEFRQSATTQTGDESTPDTVYWSDSGSKYHCDRNCRYIKNSVSVRSGSVADAGAAGVVSPCSVCGTNE